MNMNPVRNYPSDIIHTTRANNMSSLCPTREVFLSDMELVDLIVKRLRHIMKNNTGKWARLSMSYF